jgi:hypothetical protein
MKLSKLNRVDLREVWINETSDFNRWLSKSDNLALLNSEIGLKLRLVERETKAGRFRLDLLAIDDTTGDYAIIENQLTETDHKHLGQTITYAAHYNPKHIIWIVKDIRLEHEKSFKWLSDKLSMDVNLFLVKIELFQIDNSIPAPKFSLIIKPLDWMIRKSNSDLIEKLPDEFAEIERLRKIIKYQTLERFLTKTIMIDERISKLELQKQYIKEYPKDGSYFERRYSRNFDRAVRAWAELNGYEINKDFDNGKYKSGGVEYYLFTNESPAPNSRS